MQFKWDHRLSWHQGTSGLEVSAHLQDAVPLVLNHWSTQPLQGLLPPLLTEVAPAWLYGGDNGIQVHTALCILTYFIHQFKLFHKITLHLQDHWAAEEFWAPLTKVLTVWETMVCMSAGQGSSRAVPACGVAKCSEKDAETEKQIEYSECVLSLFKTIFKAIKH